MRSRDIAIPFMTGVLIFSLNVLNSCASQSRTDDASNPPPKDELAALGDIPADGEQPPPGTSGTTADASGEMPPSTETLPPASKEPQDSFTEAKGQPPSDVPLDTPPPMDNNPPPQEMGSLNNDAPTDAPVESAPIKRHSRVSGGGFDGYGRVPKIPAEALHRKNVSLNRFYFARRGDTSKKVATLIYGDKKRGKELARWNPGGFAPGRLIFYQSPAQADDNQMRSFYQERNVPTEEYAVAKGDWMSRVARKKLGDSGSWKEIAVTNGIEDPRKLEPGQKLALYPKDLSPYGAAAGSTPPPIAESKPAPRERGRNQRQARVESQPITPPVTTNNKPPPGGNPPGNNVPVAPPMDDPSLAVNNGAPPPPSEEPAFLKNKKKTKASSGPFGFAISDLSQFLQQEALFLAVGVVLMVLLLALFLVQRRKKAAAAEDFEDNAFAPAKSRRR